MSTKSDRKAAVKLQKQEHGRKVAAAIVNKVIVGILPLMGIQPDGSFVDRSDDVTSDEMAILVGGIDMMVKLVKNKAVTIDELIQYCNDAQSDSAAYIVPLVCAKLGIKFEFAGVRADELNAALDNA